MFVFLSYAASVGAQSYPGLGLNEIPWHTGSGAWGPRVQIELPALPATTRAVTVNSPSAFNTEASRSGTQITIGASWSEGVMVAISASNVDVIIPPGVSIGAIEIGVWPRQTPLSRIRIRGPVIGQHSGGRMGQFRAGGNIYSDITIDGIDMNGASGLGGGETNQAFRLGAIERFAVRNTRAIAAGYIWLGEARHVVIVNSNFYHGASTRSNVGYGEGWGIRNTAGPMTIIDSRIEGTRYVNLRSQSVGGAEELLYVRGTTFVAVHEGRNAWLWNNLNQGPWYGQAAVIENSRFYSFGNPGGCTYGHEINTNNVNYSRISDSAFYSGGNSNFTQNYLNSNFDVNSGNTFHSLAAVPGWVGPGDPKQIPLPSGMTLNTNGEAPCIFTQDTTADNDGDGIPDVSDSDDDNDGMSDNYENTHGLDPFNAFDATQDPDNDGLINLAEFTIWSNPNNPDTDGDGIIDGLDSEPLFPDNVPDDGHLWMVSPALIFW